MNTFSLSPVKTPTDLSQWNSARPLAFQVARAWCRYAPRGKGAVPRWIGRQFGRSWKTTIRTDSGCILAVDPPNLDLYVSIEKEGAWEPWIRRACIAATRPGDVFYDVGANAGTISNEVGLARPGATIKAFEPQVQLAELVAVSAALNHLTNIEVFPVAVGDHSGSVRLFKPAHALHASIKAVGTESSIDCPLISLDDALDAGLLPVPNVIKIDVEGGELGVLRGARKLLAQHKPIVLFEVNDNSQRFGYGRTDLIALIRQAGSDYRFLKIAPGDVMAVPENCVEGFDYGRIDA